MMAAVTGTKNSAASLAPLVDSLTEPMARVNATIIERLQSEVGLIPELGGHLIAAGGKRIRPLLTLAGARIASADQAGEAAAVKLATAVEFIHSATLLHDDVIDESSLRRGRDTANALWGNEASVLVGDFLFARAFELMVETGDIRVLGRLSSAAARITEGEIKQMATTGVPETPLSDYIDVISGKTAILFAAAAAAGGEVAGGDPALIAGLHEYGLNLGLAFQIMDDALDYTADAAAMGKNAGDDFADQKITMPTILAWQAGDADERAFWQRTLGAAQFEDGDLAMAQSLLTKRGAIEQSLAAAQNYAKAASHAIADCCTDQANSAMEAALVEAAAFAAARTS